MPPWSMRGCSRAEGVAPGVLHLVAGATGAGKTTHARALAGREGALLLSIDEWMTRLFWPDAPEELGTWAHERVERCTAQMRAVAGQALALGVPVVADAGFTTRADRAAFADWAEDRGVSCRLHWIDVDRDTRRARVEGRNAAGGGGTGFTVDRAMFDYMEALWQPPDAEEMQRLSGVRLRV